MRSATNIPYPAVQDHAVIGDRRTAALVSADGTIDWLCLPDYNGDIVLGSLLDHGKGGHWKLGPNKRQRGLLQYIDETAVAETTWDWDDATLVLTDFMPWPEQHRTADLEHARVVVRRLSCTRGEAACCLELSPAMNFRPLINTERNEWCLHNVNERLRLWSSRQSWLSASAPEGIREEFRLANGEALWLALQLGGDTSLEWSAQLCEDLLAHTLQYWRKWNAKLSYTGPRKDLIRRSAQTIQLLSYAPSGSLVAAPTSSLPERIRGHDNYDYRYAWIRDASLSLAVLAMLGSPEDGAAYMDWLVTLGSSTDSPFQVVYGIHGETDLTERELPEAFGYRGSQPVRVGNHAYRQHQMDSLGYLCDCALVFLEHGGKWKQQYWEIVRRCADYTAAHWRLPDNGIWEQSGQQHHVSSKVMSWTALERSIKIAEKLNLNFDTTCWKAEMSQIHDDVMQHGWSDALGSFRQVYDRDTLDASALLVSLMGFLPADHPRVLGTIERISERLSINEFVYRFAPDPSQVEQGLPLGEKEGAFLPCTFWLAAAYAKAGSPDQADKILRAAESIAGPLGLFAEQVDPRNRQLLGNTPLLFSQIEYVRAVAEIAKARPLEKAELMLGVIEQQIKKLF